MYFNKDMYLFCTGFYFLLCITFFAIKLLAKKKKWTMYIEYQAVSKVLLSPDSPSLSSRGTQRSNISLTKVGPWTDNDSLELISNPGSGKRSRKIIPTPPIEKEIQAYKPAAVENGLLHFANDSFSGVQNVNVLDMEGLSALHRAVLVDDVTTVVFLLDNDADINRMGNGGFTPLHSAVKYVHG